MSRYEVSRTLGTRQFVELRLGAIKNADILSAGFWPHWGGNGDQIAHDVAQYALRAIR